MRFPTAEKPAFGQMCESGGPDICYYHHPCNDGMTAAYFVKNRFPDCTLVPYRHGTTITPEDAKGKKILIVDLCLQDQNLVVVREHAEQWFIIDHHSTAVVLQDDPNCWIDESRSGAYLTWVALHGSDENINTLARYVDDYDRYVLADPNTEAVVAAMKKLYEKNMEDWTYIDVNLGSIVDQGWTLLKAAEKERRQVDGGQKIVYGNFLGYENIPVINCDLDGLVINALGHELGKTHPFVAFWVVGVQRSNVPDGNIMYSLRSDSANPNWVNVAEVAKHLGGGGHAQASGFRSFYAPWEIKENVKDRLDILREMAEER